MPQKDHAVEKSGFGQGFQSEEVSASISLLAFESKAPPVEYGSYSFSPFEKNVIAKTSARTRLWGVFSIVIGASCCLLFAPQQVLLGNLGLALSTGCVGVTGIVVGWFFVISARALKKVVTREGNNLENMMSALYQLGRGFLIQAFATFVTVSLVVVIFFAAASIASLLGVTR